MIGVSGVFAVMIGVVHSQDGLRAIGFVARAAAMGSSCATWIMTPELYSTDVRATAHSMANGTPWRWACTNTMRTTRGRQFNMKNPFMSQTVSRQHHSLILVFLRMLTLRLDFFVLSVLSCFCVCQGSPGSAPSALHTSSSLTFRSWAWGLSSVWPT